MEEQASPLEHGSTAPTLAADFDDQSEPTTLSPNLHSDAVVVERGPRGLFLPGKAPKSPGRPKKGETFADRYRKAVEKDAKLLIKAHVERAKGAGVVASREFALAAAYAMGRPVQPYVNVGGDDPLQQLFERMATRQALTEGDNALLPDAQT